MNGTILSLKIVRETNGKVFLAAELDSNLKIVEYLIERINKNNFENFLKVQLISRDTQQYLYYETTSYQQLSKYLENRCLNTRQYLGVLQSIIANLKSMDDHMLVRECMVLDFDKIFIEPTTMQVKLMYIPTNKKIFNLENDLKTLINKLIPYLKTNTNEIKVLNSRIIEGIHENNYVRLNTLILDAFKENKVIDDEESSFDYSAEQGDYPKEGNLPSKGRKRPKNEVITASKTITKNVFPKKFLIVAVIIQVITIAIIIMAAGGGILNDENGILDTTKLIGIILILGIFDYIATTRVLDEKNKIEVEKVITEERVQPVKTKKDSSEQVQSMPQIPDKPIKNEDDMQLGYGKTELFIDNKLYGRLTGTASGQPIEINIDLDKFDIGKLKGSVNYAIPVPTVSRIHARISYENNVFWIEDLNSLNKTKVNTTILTPGVRVQLKTNDYVSFGPDVTLTFTASV